MFGGFMVTSSLILESMTTVCKLNCRQRGEIQCVCFCREVVMETSIEEDGEVVKKVHSDKKTMKKV